MVRGRKQAEYNELIKQSDYFYILIGKNIGAYTIEEFDVALESFQSSGTPHIYTYFKKALESEQEEKSVICFKKRLDTQLSHYYSLFTHFDSVKLNLLIELVRDFNTGISVNFRDGQVVLEDCPVLSLENIPLYSRNETVQRLITKLKQLENEFACLSASKGAASFDVDLLERIEKLNEQRGYLLDQMHQMEKDMFELYSQTAKKRQAGEHLDWREKRAIDLIDLGDYEGAKNVLRDSQWDRELHYAEDSIAVKKESIRRYISGKCTLIFALRSTGGLHTNNIREIISIFEKITDLSEKYQIELDVLNLYAEFLLDQGQYSKGIAVAKRLKRYYELSLEIPVAGFGKLLNNLSILYFKNGDVLEGKKMEKNLWRFPEIWRKRIQISTNRLLRRPVIHWPFFWLSFIN